MSEERITNEQDTAISMCADLSLPIVGVTGGAGVGKTFVLGKAYRETLRMVPASKIALCAPTGRAAKRIQELTKIPAKTIHRLLEFPMPDDKPVTVKGSKLELDQKLSEATEANEAPPQEPRRNRGNRLDQRVVYVDESSMVSPTLYRQLMDALPNNGCIRFFGDNNQLPPVEQGEPPFIRVLEEEPSVTLTLNFRSGDDIVSNALRILGGRMPLRNSRFEIIYTDSPIGQLFRFVSEDFVDSDHQIIMPTRRGKFGTNRVNPTLQVKFNPSGDSLRLARFDEKDALLPIRANDKVIWIKNDYNLKMFNGDMGTVDWVNTEDGSLQISNNEQTLLVPPSVKTFSRYHGRYIDYDPRKQIELGYAVTTHKAQGSEFDTVIYCICAGQAYLLDKGNFYTAVTRAKNRVVLITDRKAMGMSLRPRRRD